MSVTIRILLGVLGGFVLGILAAFFIGVVALPTDEPREVLSDNAPAEEWPGSVSYTNTSTNQIKVVSPVVGTRITSPLSVDGEARGTWFFEGTAPMVVVDWDGKIIGQGYVTALGPWMTEDFVPFAGEMTFEKPFASGRGTLVLQRSNASALPENDAAVEIPIQF